MVIIWNIHTQLTIKYSIVDEKDQNNFADALQVYFYYFYYSYQLLLISSSFLEQEAKPVKVIHFGSETLKITKGRAQGRDGHGEPNKPKKEKLEA